MNRISKAGPLLFVAKVGDEKVFIQITNLGAFFHAGPTDEVWATREGSFTPEVFHKGLLSDLRLVSEEE